MKQSTSHVKAFTLVETIVSIGIIVFAIAGPLSIAIHSSTYTKDSKNEVITTYLAQEAVELLRFYRDTIFIQCTNNAASCPTNDMGGGNYETPAEAAWRIFKNNMGGPSGCLVSANPAGCSYDMYSFLKNPIGIPVIFSAAGVPPICGGLYRDDRTGTVTRGLYLCKSHSELAAPVGAFTKTIFDRTIRITSVPAIGGSIYDAAYNDDLRIEVFVSYAKPNGFVKTVKVIDFIRAKV